MRQQPCRLVCSLFACLAFLAGWGAPAVAVEGKWISLAPFPDPAEEPVGAVAGGKLYVMGGEVQTYEYLAAFRAVEVYDPVTNRWEKLSAMPIPRHGMAGAALGNRFHLVAGDVQSAMVPRPKGTEFHVEQHDVFEVVKP